MAEDDTQDTKSPVPPRRGARPFVGPAGGPGQPLPLLRVTPTPRPAGAPFAPVAMTRAALGAARPPEPASVPPTVGGVDTAPSDGSAIASAEITSDLADDTFDSVHAAPPATATVPSWASAVEPMTAATGDRADEATVSGEAEPLGEPQPQVEAAAHGSESFAHDQFAAFDAAWCDNPAEAPETSPAAAAAAPLPDLESLGSGDDPTMAWDPEPASAVDAGSYPETTGPAWLMDDAAPPLPAGALDVPDVDAGEAGQDCGDAVVQAGPASEFDEARTADGASDAATPEDLTIMPTAAAPLAEGIVGEALGAPPRQIDEAIPASDWPDPLLAEYAPYVPTPPIGNPVASFDTSGDVGSDAAAGRVEAVTASASAHVEGAPETTETRVAAALNRLAEQVRLGEIDVSSVAPGGPDAAVLAAVLASILGGGRSSSR